MSASVRPARAKANKATVKAGVVLKEFDFYFDFVIALVERLLNPLGNV